jgi:hypothetical protein
MTHNSKALLDLSVGSSTNGTTIPIGYGTTMREGNLIWCPGINQIASTEVISGTEVTSYDYNVSMAVAFGERPGEIVQIWGDNVLLYDNTGAFIDYVGMWNTSTYYPVGAIVTFNPGSGSQNWICTKAYTGNPPTPCPGKSWGWNYWSPYTGSVQVAGGQEYPSPTLYTGSYIQDVDPTIQNGDGICEGLGAMTSAFRGMIYAVWNQLDLTAFSNRIPSIRAVVTSGTTMSTNPYTDASRLQMQLYAYNEASGSPLSATTYIRDVIPSAEDNSWIGLDFEVQGYDAAANNGTFVCVGNTATTITLENAAGVSESACGAIAQCTGGTTTVGLDYIVTDICSRCGIDPSLVDASDLETVITTKADVYQSDGSGIPALTLQTGGMVYFYQPDYSGGAPFEYNYPGDGSKPLPSCVSFPMPDDASILWNPYPADATTIDSDLTMPMTLVGVVSGEVLMLRLTQAEHISPLRRMTITLRSLNATGYGDRGQAERSSRG